MQIGTHRTGNQVFASGVRKVAKRILRWLINQNYTTERNNLSSWCNEIIEKKFELLICFQTRILLDPSAQHSINEYLCLFSNRAV